MKSIDGILGLAIADAMGVPLEFCMREKLQQDITTTMKGYGSHPVPKGTWSDDTSMTLALIDAINKSGEIVPKDIANNFVDWIEKAKYTATNETFDIGRTCLQAISNFERGVTAEDAGMDGEYSNGNGSLMRILPLVYFCYTKGYCEEQIYECVKIVSSITHKHEVSIMGCYIYVLYGIELLKGKTLEDAYKEIQAKNYSYFSTACIERYNRILNEDISKYDMVDIKSTGYVVDTLEATFWCLLNTTMYKEAVVKSINLGNDTDTVGACTGGLAGIVYGVETIPEDWKKDLIKKEYVETLCNELDNVLSNK